MCLCVCGHCDALQSAELAAYSTHFSTRKTGSSAFLTYTTEFLRSYTLSFLRRYYAYWPLTIVIRTWNNGSYFLLQVERGWLLPPRGRGVHSRGSPQGAETDVLPSEAHPGLQRRGSRLTRRWEPTHIAHHTCPPAECSRTISVAIQMAYKVFCNTYHCQINVTLNKKVTSIDERRNVRFCDEIYEHIFRQLTPLHTN